MLDIKCDIKIKCALDCVDIETSQNQGRPFFPTHLKTKKMSKMPTEIFS